MRENLSKEKAEEQNKFFNLPLHLLIISELDGTIKRINPGWKEKLGYEIEELIGKKFLDLVHPDDRKATIGEMEKLSEGITTFAFENRYLHKDGSYKTLAWSANADTKKGHIYGIAHDITKRKKMEDDLKDSEEKYREAYHRAEIYKDLFAHDISNILQNIKSSNGLLKMWQENPANPKMIKEVIQIVDNQVLRGAKLISNIRKLSQVSEKVESLKNIKPMEQLNDAIKFIHKSYLGKQIKIKLESQINEPIIFGNDLLLDIYENILINAVKYNENSVIEVIVKISKTIEDDIRYIKFEFIDNGIGLSDDMKEGIFNGTTKHEDKAKGMGLGLILVRKIIQSFNGKIWVEDSVKGDPSQGCNFIVLLPEVP